MAAGAFQWAQLLEPLVAELVEVFAGLFAQHAPDVSLSDAQKAHIAGTIAGAVSGVAATAAPAPETETVPKPAPLKTGVHFFGSTPIQR